MSGTIEDLGRWMGRREAFALIAGRCSAAEAESLRRIREEKSYKQVCKSWEEFCAKRLGVSRRQIDRTLRLLDEFGPAYFHVAQMAHVTPDEYRAIAPHVGDDGVHVDGAVVALLPENSEQVSAAVAGLLERERPAKPEKRATGLEAVIKRCDGLADTLSGIETELTVDQRIELTAAIFRVHKAAVAKGIVTL